MRIGIVNDMAMARECLRRIVARASGFQVAWIARDGAEAADRCKNDLPDLILMDLVMPVMNGVEATRIIMRDSPCPILVVTASTGSNHSLVYDALLAGAVDVVSTPSFGDDGYTKAAERLLEKIGTSARQTIRKLTDIPKRPPAPIRKPMVKRSAPAGTIIAIGASTGGPSALINVIAPLPTDIAAAVVVVLHVDVQFAKGMVDWVDSMVSLPVHLAEEGEEPKTGNVYVAGTNEHLVLNRFNKFHYTEDPVDYPYRPSANTFFQSLVKNWRGEAIGVLLTGMGKDGALGLKAMCDNGWHTIAQDMETSTVYGMPKAAVDLGAAIDVLPLNLIGADLAERIRHQKTTRRG